MIDDVCVRVLLCVFPAPSSHSRALNACTAGAVVKPAHDVHRPHRKEALVVWRRGRRVWPCADHRCCSAAQCHHNRAARYRGAGVHASQRAAVLIRCATNLNFRRGLVQQLRPGLPERVRLQCMGQFIGSKRRTSVSRLLRVQYYERDGPHQRRQAVPARGAWCSPLRPHFNTLEVNAARFCCTVQLGPFRFVQNQMMLDCSWSDDGDVVKCATFSFACAVALLVSLCMLSGM